MGCSSTKDVEVTEFNKRENIDNENDLNVIKFENNSNSNQLTDKENDNRKSNKTNEVNSNEQNI